MKSTIENYLIEWKQRGFSYVQEDNIKYALENIFEDYLDEEKVFKTLKMMVDEGIFEIVCLDKHNKQDKWIPFKNIDKRNPENYTYYYKLLKY